MNDVSMSMSVVFRLSAVFDDSTIVENRIELLFFSGVMVIVIGLTFSDVGTCCVLILLFCVILRLCVSLSSVTPLEPEGSSPVDAARASIWVGRGRCWVC